METVAATERNDISEAESSEQNRKRKKTQNPAIHGKKRRKETTCSLNRERKNLPRRFCWKKIRPVKKEKKLLKKEKKLLKKEKMLAKKEKKLAKKEKNLLKKQSLIGEETDIEEMEDLGGEEVPQVIIDDFCERKESAIQHFNFIDYLREQCDFIKRDSCPNEVFDSGELPLEKFALVGKEGLMHSLKVHIMKLEAEYKTRLYCKYCLYLPYCDFIKYDSMYSEILEVLKKDINFQKQNFLELPSSRLIYGLKFYINYLFDMKERNGRKWFDYTEEMEKQLEGSLLVYKKRPSPDQYFDPVYKLVLQTREKGYIMDDDPKVEVLKIMNSFGASRRRAKGVCVDASGAC